MFATEIIINTATSAEKKKMRLNAACLYRKGQASPLRVHLTLHSAKSSSGGSNRSK